MMNHQLYHARFAKEPATVEAQLAKLEERGCIIEDREYAAGILEKINYYRLANYFAVYGRDVNWRQSGIKTYSPGTSFNKVLRLYDFDRRLRGHLLIFLEEIEISVRAVISNYHALKYGALGYLNESSFGHNHNHQRFVARIERLIETNTDVGFVMHHNRKHGGALPLWVMMELFSFGMLAHFFDSMTKTDKKEIVERYFRGQLSTGHIESWLDSLAALRNHCAHYCRLYANRIEPAPKPLLTDNMPFTMSDNLFSFIFIIKMLDKNLLGGETVDVQLGGLFEEFSDVIDISVLGFPPNWKELLD